MTETDAGDTYVTATDNSGTQYRKNDAGEYVQILSQRRPKGHHR